MGIYSKALSLLGIQPTWTAEQRIEASTDYSRREIHTDDLGGGFNYVGAAHSAGGHTMGIGQRVTSDSLLLCVGESANRNVNLAQLEAGATWKQVLQRGYVPESMQAYHDMSIGGSVSANAHGGFYNCQTVGNTVEAMKVDGEWINPSHKKFWHVVGGYGLCGRIEEVTLRVKPDCFLKEQHMLVPTDAIVETTKNPCYRWTGHLNRDWTESYVTLGFREEFTEFDEREYEEPNFFYQNLAFNLPYGARWMTEKAVSGFPRAKASSKFGPTHWFEPKVTFPWRYSYLMEYFIPTNLSPYWCEEVRKNGLQPTGMMNTTVRMVAADRHSIMTYSPEDSLAFVIYGRTGSDESRLIKETRSLIDLTLEYSGKYYLPYRPHATRSQFRKSYPNWDKLQVKEGIWSNFYENYLSAFESL